MKLCYTKKLTNKDNLLKVVTEVFSYLLKYIQRPVQYHCVKFNQINTSDREVLIGAWLLVLIRSRLFSATISR